MKHDRALLAAGIGTLALLAALILLLFSSWTARKTAEVHLPETQARLPGESLPAVPEELALVKVEPDTVQAVIATLHRPDSYSRSISVESMWDSGIRTAQIDVWVKNGMQRMTVTENGARKQYLLIDGELTVWQEEDPGRRFTYSGGGSLGDSLQRIPTYEDLLTLDPARIRTAGCTRTERGKWRILVTADSAELGYLDVYYISLDTGLLEAAEQWDGDSCVYRMQAGEADLSAPDDQLFRLPD